LQIAEVRFQILADIRLQIAIFDAVRDSEIQPAVGLLTESEI
jgi:hypothetical protein